MKRNALAPVKEIFPIFTFLETYLVAIIYFKKLLKPISCSSKGRIPRYIQIGYIALLLSVGYFYSVSGEFNAFSYLFLFSSSVVGKLISVTTIHDFYFLFWKKNY